MIFETVELITNELNRHLSTLPGISADEQAVIGNIAAAGNMNDATGNLLHNKIVVSLMHLEEDRLAKQGISFGRQDDARKIQTQSFSLYLLIAINKEDYKESLRLLDVITGFFHQQPLFTLAGPTPELPGLKMTLVEFFSLNLEQSAQMWNMLGTKQLPSVVYKLRSAI